MFTITNGTMGLAGAGSACAFDARSLLFGLLTPVLLAASIAGLMALLRRLHDASSVYGDRVREHASGEDQSPSALVGPEIGRRPSDLTSATRR